MLRFRENDLMTLNFFQLGHTVLIVDLSLQLRWVVEKSRSSRIFILFYFINGGLAAPSQVEAKE